MKATLLLDAPEATEEVLRCRVCGAWSIGSVRGCAGWVWLKLGPGSRATVECCADCAKEKRPGETILGCLLAAT